MMRIQHGQFHIKVDLAFHENAVEWRRYTGYDDSKFQTLTDIRSKMILGFVHEIKHRKCTR